jgi:pimeloyl-ACP methyl ester carboxylesterase
MAEPPLTTGSGEHKVLAVHGWFGSARGWGTLPAHLDQARYTYAFLDLRGYGDRQQAVGEFTMEEAAADVLALADELGWDRFSLVGHSMGGVAIQHVLLRAPDRVRALVAVTPVPASGVPMDEAGWALFSGAAADLGNRAAIVDFSTGSRLDPAFVDGVVQHSVRNSAAAAFGAYLDSWARADFAGQVAGNPAPVRVVVGEHDQALTAGLMRETWLAWYPNAELSTLPGTGHYPMLETPAALAACIEEFLARH